ncbi:unnamed protein product [Phyllotreta striolata]|uniref:Tyrosine-protein kinase receptor n=1 Tax=Phyllotreta striolata TaxID=444603 RepID=A0A9N9TMP0_PHYSR|nr:unnamed protein product [Phyllotreta striolata]
MRNSILAVFVFCCVVVRTDCFDYSDSDVESGCVENCPKQNRTDTDHYSYACDHDCFIEQCVKGCKLWRKALSSTCKETCPLQNGTTERLKPKYLYCVRGCNYAVDKYVSNLKQLIGTPPVPALLADSLRSNSLKLEWNFPAAKKMGLSCLPQWRYEELSASKSAWQSCRNTTWDADANVFYLQDLQPYTKYRFRIAIFLDSEIGQDYGELAVSSESVVISTAPDGPPASPPQNVRANPVDSSSISISWEPGPFPHGPLLSYVLNITDNHRSEVKDIPPDKSDIVVGDLKALNNYSVELRMRNKDGSGPPATITVSTPAERQMTNIQQPHLILATNSTVFEINHIILEVEPRILYISKIELKGIGFHYSKRLLFVADSDGYVTKIHLYRDPTTSMRILEPQNLDFKPLDLNVDWLNDQLYILGEIKFNTAYIIKRCDLDGGNLVVVYAGLNQKPSSMQIDPLNGYLFWAIQDYNNGGFFRLDINDISNGIPADKKIKKILNETELGAFTFEYQNFNVLLSYHRLNTIISISLDGQDHKNIRPNVSAAKLTKVVSLAMENRIFYWTDGVDVYFEEYNKQQYYHNTMTEQKYGHYKKVFIDSPNFQPWPTPINPPTSVQAIFDRDIAKTRWQPPHLVGLQGKGAWQNWSYEISIREAANEEPVYYRNINTTSYTIPNLKENTEYILKVAAYTKSGRGPWSSDFRGITLNSTESPVLLWSAAEGLLKSNAAGENLEVLIDRSTMRDYYYTDIAWIEDQVFLVTNTSLVYRYNTTSKIYDRLVDLDQVGSIAVDWIGMKLYWSSPKQQLILRANLNGSEQEPLLPLLVKELNIDSVKAYLYYSSGIKLECARLNGVERVEYHDVQFFSGKQIMGLTLDFEQKFVYWIVRGNEGSILYRARMMGYWENNMPNVEIISSLQKPNIQGSLSYFHKRLLWLQDDRNAAISDLSGKNIATINGKYMQGLQMVYVADSSLYMLPDPWLQVNVIPSMVDENSVKVYGSYQSFNITWNPITNVNYGTVFYELQDTSQSKLNSFDIVTTEPSIKYWLNVTPFTPINISIRAFTYWAASPLLHTQIITPSSTPSAPLNLRTFVEFERHSSLENHYVNITLRWDPPATPNGVLQGYKLRCWNAVNEDLCDNDVVINDTEYRLRANSGEYFFEVQGFTKVGLGEKSAPISVNTAVERPIPALLVASESSISLYDIDLNETTPLLTGVIEPKLITYHLKDNNIFWVDKKGELFVLNWRDNIQRKIFEINGQVDCITLDWVGKSLYYAQRLEGECTSAIFQLDLSANALESRRILESSEGAITQLEVSPFTRSLYWIETSRTQTYELKQSDIDGSYERSFFTKHPAFGKLSNSNCPYKPQIGPYFALDHSGLDLSPRIVFLDARCILWADKYSDTCGLLVDFNEAIEDFPMKNLEADFLNVYWTNGGVVHSVDWKEQIAKKQISDMKIYGKHVQPYPPQRCLSPKQHNNYTVSLASKTFDSVVIELPEPLIYNECRNISMARIKYTVYYTEFVEGFDCDANANCSMLVTSDRRRVLDHLKPYTKYLIRVAVTNEYSKENDIIIGPPSVFQTSPGVPSQSRNVSALVLSPNLAVISWLPPEVLNGIKVYYQILFQTENTPSGVRQRGEVNVNSSNVFNASLTNLSANETYTIWVRSYSETNDTYSDSDRVQITTYPGPNPLLLADRSAYELRLSWEPTDHTVSCKIEYSLLTNNDWQSINSTRRENDTLLIRIDHLKPKTHYKFRLRLLYEGYNEEYIWPNKFTYETLGDRPSPPGIPIIQYVNPNTYKVLWEASKDNGAPITIYKLEGKTLRFYRNKRSTSNRTAYFNTAPSIELEETEQWVTYYNGTNTSWIINGLNEKQKYAFRVSALNSYGWSNFSEESNEFDLTEAARMAEKQNPTNLIVMAITIPIAICVALVLFLIIIVYFGKDKEKALQQLPIAPKGPDGELVRLRDMPTRGIHRTNLLYEQPTEEELKLLPQIKREQITLTQFLGSGAFGEVFEGKAKGIDGINVETKVAVKTLKKGASDQEKCDFLKEANLMSHFQHEHILQLLGVCLDNDPQFIIMELMEGGDLLSYLRNSRNPSTSTQPLTLIELLKMCVDVSKGCRYLEEKHFVHRDLACRNCLVSSNDTESRIVKIGDFGLARDVYKNDYYRKEGEALLPVRWMAPESLTDGFFTSQSDVWSFGVLLWEIMTLGQQPYPARTNTEVLHYVRRGGRLGKPVDCPEELHNLLLKCWEFDPEKRPTFKYCFEVLEALHRQTLRNPTTGAHEGQYVSTVPDLFAGISNAAYFRDENHNSSGNSWRSPDESPKEMMPLLNKEEAPKYLEVIMGPESVLENDGYEVPNKF